MIRIAIVLMLTGCGTVTLPPFYTDSRPRFTNTCSAVSEDHTQIYVWSCR